MSDLEDGLHGGPYETPSLNAGLEKAVQVCGHQVVPLFSFTSHSKPPNLRYLPGSAASTLSGESGSEREADLARCEDYMEQKVKEGGWTRPEKTGFSLAYSSLGDGKGKRKFINMPLPLTPMSLPTSKTLLDGFSGSDQPFCQYFLLWEELDGEKSRKNPLPVTGIWRLARVPSRWSNAGSYALGTPLVPPGCQRCRFCLIIFHTEEFLMLYLVTGPPDSTHKCSLAREVRRVHKHPQNEVDGGKRLQGDSDPDLGA